MRPVVVALAVVLAAPVAGCSGCGKDEHPPPPSSVASAQPPPAAPAPGDPAAAIQRMIQRLGTDPLVPQLPDAAPKGDLLLFPVPGEDARALVLKHHGEAFELGAYLFLFKPGPEKSKALLGLAPTRDALDVVRIVGTASKSPPHDNAAVVAWLRDLDHDQPLGLSGVGIDFLEGAFDGPLKDPAGIAAKVNAFCPDFAANLAAAHDSEARDAVQRWFAANRTFYFSWD